MEKPDPKDKKYKYFHRVINKMMFNNQLYSSDYQKWKALQNKNSTVYSTCCGAEIKNTDYDLCPDCGEHTGFEDEDGNEIEATF